MQHRWETRSPLPAKQKTQKKNAPKEMGPQYVRMYGPKIKAIIRTGNPDDGINLLDAGRGTLTAAATIWSRAYHSNYAYHVRPKVVTLSKHRELMTTFLLYVLYVCIYISAFIK
ncbi:CEI_1a_G0050310.mRNA.1.CDS.1 [Saccharomyces cerevisiae]|nr:EM14S01-3B_G0028570.mRNA.1.CDS.1 [Saccharomyces cerevisiae]CAI4788083.1 CEI_1a_G0050310.mRNA.1.CDS.1 [Saccharomyces cerevisiae]CAI4794914.1 AMH_1a_G0050410.mRNA.1.CDS.1 [Saccharomyces cerevisiae]CAI6884479.1 AMH_1a_G0050410.mRNA.1.CDS.1 [Saccharomyces cerevisiae]CAI7463213.1 CEI_1a_G0050310.mRNA.1.CDS.1 [Saccharomyces cerevisiae]